MAEQDLLPAWACALPPGSGADVALLARGPDGGAEVAFGDKRGLFLGRNSQVETRASALSTRCALSVPLAGSCRAPTPCSQRRASGLRTAGVRGGRGPPLHVARPCVRGARRAAESLAGGPGLRARCARSPPGALRPFELLA